MAKAKKDRTDRRHGGLRWPNCSGSGQPEHVLQQRDPHAPDGGYRQNPAMGGLVIPAGPAAGRHEETARRLRSYLPPVSTGTGQTLTGGKNNGISSWRL